MKFLLVAAFVSALLFLQTVTALSALKYLWQSPSGNANKYQNRDSMPRSIRRAVMNDNLAEQKNELQTTPYSNDETSPQRRIDPAYLSADQNQAWQDQPINGVNKFKQYIGLASVFASIYRLSQATAPQIDSAIANIEPNLPAESKVREFTTDMRFLVNNRDVLQLYNSLEPGLKPFENFAVSYPSIFNPIFNLLDWALYELTERSVPVIAQILDVAQAARGDSVDKDAVSKKFRQYVKLISVGANVARLSQKDAQEIDSVLADLATKYSSDTEMGDFIAGMRYMLRNRGGLKLWAMSEPNMKNIEELAAHEPNLFNPVFYAGDAIGQEMAKRFSAAITRFGEAVRSDRMQSQLSQQ